MMEEVARLVECGPQLSSHNWSVPKLPPELLGRTLGLRPRLSEITPAEMVRLAQAPSTLGIRNSAENLLHARRHTQVQKCAITRSLGPSLSPKKCGTTATLARCI